MLFAAGSPAKTSPSPGDRPESTPSARDSGPTSPELLAKWHRATRSWRTSQRCFLETEADGLAEFLETWPRSGTTQNGTAYRLPTLAPITGVTASGLLPTPTAADSRGARNATANNGKGSTRNPGTTLSDVAWMVGGTLNPTWVEWLMGFPCGWTDCEPSETPSSRRSLK